MISMLLKKLILIFSLLSILSCKRDIEQKTIYITNDYYGLLDGKVKRLILVRHGQMKDYYKHDTIDFDSNGNVLQERFRLDSLTSNVNYYTKYDKYKRKIISSVKGTAIYEFGKRGFITQVLWQDNGGVFLRKDSFIYDTQGYLIERNSYNGSGAFLGKIHCKNDDKGNLLEADYITNPNEAAIKVNYKYEGFDDRYNWTKITRSTHVTGKLFSYDAKDTLYQEITYY